MHFSGIQQTKYTNPLYTIIEWRRQCNVVWLTQQKQRYMLQSPNRWHRQSDNSLTCFFSCINKSQSEVHQLQRYKILITMFAITLFERTTYARLLNKHLYKCTRTRTRFNTWSRKKNTRHSRKKYHIIFYCAILNQTHSMSMKTTLKLNKTSLKINYKNSVKRKLHKYRVNQRSDIF